MTIATTTRRALLAAAIGVALIPTAAHATAETLPPATPVLRLPWSELGVSGPINLTSPDAQQTYTVAVPTGTTPATLTGLIARPVNLQDGWVEVDDSQGTYLGTIRFASGRDSTAPQPFSVSLRHATVASGSVGLQFVLRSGSAGATAGQAWCGPLPQETLSDLHTSYSGAAVAPTSPATFLPSVLRRLVILTPETPSLNTQNAAITLASSIVAQYRPQHVSLEVRSISDLAPLGLDPRVDRVIRIRPQPAVAGLAVNGSWSGAPVLTISGSDARLSRQAALFIDRLQAVAAAPRATVTLARKNAVSATKVATFGQLGMAAQTSVLGQSQMSVTLDQSLFARPLTAADVDLILDYTPVTPGAHATATVTTSGVTVASAVLGSSGRSSLRFRLPAALLRSQTSLAMTLTYAPQGQVACSPVTPTLTASIDPRSTVSATFGQPDNGFSGLPQSLQPAYQVAIADPTVAELSIAADLVASLQEQASGQLHPYVTSFRSATASGSPAVLVAPMSAVGAAGLNPPLGGSANTATTDRLRVTQNAALGSLQVFTDAARGHTVLLATTTGSWTLVAAIIDSQLAGTSPWSSVAGDVLLNGGHGAPRALTLRAGAVPQFTPDASTEWIWWYLGAGALAATLLLLATGYMWGRRRPPVPQESP